MVRATAARTSVLLTALALAAAGSAAAQSGERFGAEEHVTAVDLMVELDPPHRLRPWNQPPQAEDLRVLVDGRELPAVAVDPPPRTPEAAQWEIVLYFDLALSDRIQVSWAADLLSSNLRDLTLRGPVELVVADPDPRTLVSATRDTARIAETLDRLSFFPEAEDALVESRLERMRPERRAGDDGPGAQPDEQGAPTLQASYDGTALERALIRDRLDALLLTLADRAAGAPPRRAVFLVSGGYELATERSAGRDLEAATRETARALAAYGWSIVPLLAPPPEGTVPGLRIGKWRLHWPRGSRGVPFPLLSMTRESERDPEQARAYLELARARRDQGDLEGAGRAARRALTHFADDPRTAELQAEALLVLAEVYGKQERHQLARRTYLRAATRDPEGLAEHPAVVAAIERPGEALELLANATLGRLLPAEREWQAVLHTLDRRGAVTLQIPGLPDGRLHRAEVVWPERGEGVSSGGSVRFGTPRVVAAARARRLLEDVPKGGRLQVTAALLDPRDDGAGSGTEAASRTRILRVVADPPGRRQRPGIAVLTLTLATPHPEGGIGGEVRVEHFGPETLDPAPSAPWSWELRREVGLEEESAWGVVVLEDLVTGRWGTTLAQRSRQE